MILSHHAPVDYNRTFRILGVRFCTRCAGTLLGAVLAFLLFHYFENELSVWLMTLMCLTLPLPAAADFACNELKFFSSNNFLRLLTGILLGIPLGISLDKLAEGSLLIPLFTFSWYILIECIIVLLFRKLNHHEEYIGKYTNAVYRNAENRS